jgi:hypothetical protein
MDKELKDKNRNKIETWVFEKTNKKKKQPSDLKRQFNYKYIKTKR